MIMMMININIDFIYLYDVGEYNFYLFIII
jgi:hypothetical protein